MCQSSSSKPVTTVTDPLANLKTANANQAYNQYTFGIPYSQDFLTKIMPNLGNFNWNQPGSTPDTLVKSDAALNDILSGGGSKVADTFSGLKQNLLGVYDTGVQKYTLDPLKEQLISQGIYSSGPGMDAYQNAATNAAQERGLLGSQADTQMLDLMSQFITQGQSLGTQEFNMGQQMGLGNPIAAFNAFNSLQAPTFQNIATDTRTMPNNSGAFGALLSPFLSAAAQSIFKGGGGTTLPNTPGGTGVTAGSGAGGFGGVTAPAFQNLLGQIGLQNDPSAGNAYDPSQTPSQGMFTDSSSGINSMNIMGGNSGAGNTGGGIMNLLGSLFSNNSSGGSGGGMGMGGGGYAGMLGSLLSSSGGSGGGSNQGSQGILGYGDGQKGWGGALNGGVQGAEMGSSFGPYGTIIGGVLGALIGAFTK